MGAGKVALWLVVDVCPQPNPPVPYHALNPYAFETMLQHQVKITKLISYNHKPTCIALHSETTVKDNQVKTKGGTLTSGVVAVRRWAEREASKPEEAPQLNRYFVPVVGGGG